VHHNLGCSPNITEANVKSEIAVQVACMGKILVATSWGLNHLSDLGVDGRLVLNMFNRA
jgi:hypothetical protein